MPHLNAPRDPDIELARMGAQALTTEGFSLLRDGTVRSLSFYDEALFEQFRDCWNRLTQDKYMADGGKYRFRRYGTFAYDASRSSLDQEPHAPFNQPGYINSLNGDTDRWFDPLERQFVENPFFVGLLGWFMQMFGNIEGKKNWKVWVHTYRVIAQPEAPGMPTPEGIHRDGTDYILSMVVNRVNISGGESGVYDADKLPLCKATLAPREVIVQDDRRTRHDVTPLVPVNPQEAAYRDALILGFSMKTWLA